MNIIKYIIMTLATIFTTAGVVVHDTHATSFTGVYSGHYKPNAVMNVRDILAVELHTHPERAGRNLVNGFTYHTPSIPPREKKVMLSSLRRAGLGGRHAFDNVYLPIVS